MNDDRDHRLHGEQRSEKAGERTGFWSPQWDEADDSAPDAGKPSPSRPASSSPAAQPQGPPPGVDAGTRPRRPSAGPRRATPPGGPRGPNRTSQADVPAQPTVRVPLPPRPPRDPSDAPTEELPPVAETVLREPELITHREPLPDELAHGGPDDIPDGAAALSEAQQKKARRKKAWRRVRRTCYVLMGLGILSPIVAFFIAYQNAKVPSPDDILGQANQVGLITYADGSEMTKVLPKDAHALVKYNDLPEHARQAVYAAEDRSFLQNKGFDFQAIARAVWNNLSGGGGGGSTISQQYVKNATKQDQRTLSRKFMELATSAKMNKTQPKQDIISAYLNIIYFGRGATGIEEASQAYFHHPAKDLTLSEGALLAGIIQSPNRWDPAVNLAAAKRRWTYVLNGMVTNGAIDQATRDAQKFPDVRPSAEGTAAIKTSLIGPRVYIENQVMRELEQQGRGRKIINQNGLKITTTIDPRAQQAAEDAYKEVMVTTKQPDYLLAALVAVDPKTGGVIAYHGSGTGTGTDWANELQQPGSSFKPFVFTAALQQGGGLLDSYDGSSPRTFEGRPDPVRNAGDVPCKPTPNPCTVKDAMTQSVNTVFYDMGLHYHTAKVAEAAHQAGIPKEVTDADGTSHPLLVRYDSNKQPIPNSAPDGNISIGGGDTRVRPLDMAYAYSTFANNGLRTGTAPHFVSKVVDSQGKTVYEYHEQATPAFDQADHAKNADIARNVTESMIDVPKASNLALSDNRPVAGKTGTEQSERDKNPNADSAAWMAGYTPQVAAAVWVGANEDRRIKGNYTGCNSPTTPCRPDHDIFGRQEPGVIWQKFMDAYLNGKPPQGFPKLNPLGKPPTPSSSAAPPTSTAERTGDQTPQPTTSEAPTATTTTKPPKTRPTVPTIPTCSFLAGCTTTTTTATVTTTPPGGGGGGGG